MSKRETEKLVSKNLWILFLTLNEKKEKFHSGSKLKLIHNRILIDTWLKFLMTKVIWHFGYLIFYKVSSLFRQMRCAIWHLGVIFSIFYYYCLFWQFSFIEFTRKKTSNKWNSKLFSSFILHFLGALMNIGSCN